MINFALTVHRNSCKCSQEDAEKSGACRPLVLRKFDRS
jgi:hypothetical protein